MPSWSRRSQPASVVAIVDVLETLVLPHGRGVDELYVVAALHQPIHQPVPIEGGLHCDGRQLLLVGLQRRQDRLEGVGDSATEDRSELLVEHGEVTIV
jgi:hypothetical protein